MQRVVLPFYPQKTLLILTFLGAAFFQAPQALAQHAGAGGGGHFGGTHVATPHVASPRAAVPVPARAAVPPFRIAVRPGPIGLGASGFRLRTRPTRPRPVFPIVPFPVFFGGPFFGFGPGYGFSILWWPRCGPFWSWGFGCNSAPFAPYYGFGDYTPANVSLPYVTPQEYASPRSYYGGEESRQRPQLFLKDGTVYVVNDYWLVDGQIHFKTLEEGGTKLVEHAIPFEDLDLQRTIDVNIRMGFRFVLRNAPLEHYLRDRSEDNRPAEAAPPPENR